MTNTCPNCGIKMEHHPQVTDDGEVLVFSHVPGSEACVVAEDFRSQLAQARAENERLAKKIALMGAMAGNVDKDDALRLIAKEAAKEQDHD